MVQGDLYAGKAGTPSIELPSVTSSGPQNIDLAVPLSGGFIQSAWNHAFSNRSDTTLQISFDRYKRDDQLREERGTFNVDFQHYFAWGARQAVVWGANYRNTNSDSHGNLLLSLSPAKVDMQLFSSFVQDDIAVFPDKLHFTIGVRLDHNYYTGFNLLPSGRVAWTPSERRTLWAAVSRANRTPAETDIGIRLNFGGFTGPGGVPALTALVGNPHFADEVLTDYEVGYRTALLKELSIDVAAFYGDYSHQQTLEPGAPFLEITPAPPHLVLPETFENLMHGESHGLEAVVNWNATSRWTLSPGYAFEQIHMHLDPTSKDTVSVLDAEGTSPAHSAQLRSHLDLNRGLAWDASAYFVDRLRSGEVPAYTRVDTGFTWSWTEHLSSSIVGQDLLEDRHLEFVDDSGLSRSTLVKRSVYAKFMWKF